MENANNDVMVVVHYNVVNGGDKRGNAQASTIIYKMEDMDAAYRLFNSLLGNLDHNALLVVNAYRKQRGEWRNVFDTINLRNVTYIEWPKNMLEEPVQTTDE